MKGIVIKYFDERGFGFIQTPEVTNELFFHITDMADRLIRTIKIGEKVEFNIEQTPKGPTAIEVKIV